MTIVANMSAALKLSECYDEVEGDNVDDILKRLSAVEQSVSGIAATMPHLATKSDIRDGRVEISELRTEVRSIAAIVPHMATKADLNAEMGSLRAELRSGFATQRAEAKVSELTLVKWIIAIVLSSAGLAASIARFAH
jgi:hypothetical protein